MALKLDILANTRSYVQEMKKAGASTEDISDALDELIRQGDEMGDEMERTFKDMARAADTSADKIGDDYKKGFRKAESGLDDFKQEGKQTSAEVAASFDGSVESIGEGFQELAANALGGFGPLGAAAGVALAAGIGVVMSEFTAMQEETKRITDGIIDDFLRVGDALDDEAVQARVDEFLNTEEGRKQVQMLADLLNTAPGAAALAMAGDFESAGVTVEDTIQAIADAPGNVDLDVLAGLRNTIDSTSEAFEVGAEAADIQRQAASRLANQTKEEARATADAIKKNADVIRQAYAAPIPVRVTADISGINNAQWALKNLQDQARRGIDVQVRANQRVWQ